MINSIRKIKEKLGITLSDIGDVSIILILFWAQKQSYLTGKNEELHYFAFLLMAVVIFMRIELTITQKRLFKLESN